MCNIARDKAEPPSEGCFSMTHNSAVFSDPLQRWMVYLNEGAGQKDFAFRKRCLLSYMKCNSEPVAISNLPRISTCPSLAFSLEK